MGAVLLQLARKPTTQRVGFGQERKSHVKARSEGVHGGAGLGHHRLPKLDGPGIGLWMQPEDQAVPARIPLWGHPIALFSTDIQAEEEVQTGLSRALRMVAGALYGGQDPAVSLRDGASRGVHIYLEATPAFGCVKTSSPVAAVVMACGRRSRSISQRFFR